MLESITGRIRRHTPLVAVFILGTAAFFWGPQNGTAPAPSKLASAAPAIAGTDATCQDAPSIQNPSQFLFVNCAGFLP